ncbi:hypothetical protein [Lysinibacillus xylanilyticus]|uniref:hypothetical protein n=1 Tax=Lysinibacillus xylanilyticus TaxID=582475 RepID=UPI003D0155E0
MEKGVLFFTLSVACLWLILDDLFGTKKVSGLAQSLTPDFSTPIDKFMNGSLTKEEKEQGVKDAKDKVDKSKAIKTDDAKKAVKDLIDHEYLKSGGMVTS